MAKLTIQSWIDHRKLAGTDQAPIITIPPEQNVLIGQKTIMNYLGINSPVTFYQWVELYALPAVKRPDDGRWMTTMTAIDQWIFLACEVHNKRRAHTYGTNNRLTIAKERLERQIQQEAARKADAKP